MFTAPWRQPCSANTRKQNVRHKTDSAQVNCTHYSQGIDDYMVYHSNHHIITYISFGNFDVQKNLTCVWPAKYCIAKNYVPNWSAERPARCILISLFWIWKFLWTNVSKSPPINYFWLFLMRLWMGCRRQHFLMLWRPRWISASESEWRPRDSDKNRPRSRPADGHAPHRDRPARQNIVGLESSTNQPQDVPFFIQEE